MKKAAKRAKLGEIMKLDDANNAGMQRSSRCSLIMTEGDSAKALVVSDLSAICRDDCSIFPLRGRILNMRNAGQKRCTIV